MRSGDIARRTASTCATAIASTTMTAATTYIARCAVRVIASRYATVKLSQRVDELVPNLRFRKPLLYRGYHANERSDCVVPRGVAVSGRRTPGRSANLLHQTLSLRSLCRRAVRSPGSCSATHRCDGSETDPVR